MTTLHPATEICEAVADAAEAIAPVLPEPARGIVSVAAKVIDAGCDVLEVVLDIKDGDQPNG